MNAHLKPLVLHAHSSGPNPVKIAIALEALNIPFTVKIWDFSDDPNTGVKGTSYLKINENGRVPALEDPNTGIVSWESGACMNYVRRVYDVGNMIGPPGGSAQELVDFDKWEYFLLTTLGPMTGQVNWFKHYHPTKNEDALERYRVQTYRCYDVLEGQLEKSGGQSVLPGRVSTVDFHFEPWVRQHEFAGLSLDKYPCIAKWLRIMDAREDVQEAYCKIKGKEK